MSTAIHRVPVGPVALRTEPRTLASATPSPAPTDEVTALLWLGGLA